MELALSIESRDGRAEATFPVERLVIAGWAGRDRAAMEHHIAELEALGVRRPTALPTFYRVAAARLTRAAAIETPGERSSGEAEAVLFARDGALFVGLGSDHTDRAAEAYDVTVSKQMCDKPVAGTVWPFAEVADHWDRLVLRSWTTVEGARRLYQEGPVSGLLAPADLLWRYASDGRLSDGTAMFCGTLPAIGGIASGERFEAALEDPVLGRTIALAYDVVALPVAP